MRLMVVKYLKAILPFLTVFILCGCIQNVRMVKQEKNLPEENYLATDFTREDLADFYENLSSAHKDELIRGSLKEKYVSGVSYPYEYVFYHNYMVIKKNGFTVEYIDYAIRVNTANSVKDMGEQIISFYASSETVKIMKASVYASDGREISTDLSSIREKEPYTGLIYSDLKLKSLSLQGLHEGSVLRVVMKRTEKPNASKAPIFQEIGLDNYIPAKERVHLLRFEVGTEYIKKERILSKGSEPVTSKISVADNNDTLHFYLIADGRPKIGEPGSIPRKEFDNRVYFYTPGTWDEIANRYYSLMKAKVKVTEKVIQEANLITKDFGSKEDKIKAIYDFVKSIRYVSILLNQHEIVPHEASLTLRNGYGDCKDKAVLLMAMLKAIGIDSSIALVNTNYLVNKDIPSLSVFDHAIVAIPDGHGAYSFLDATGPYAHYGLLPLFLQNRSALVVGEKGGEFVLIPPQPPEKNQVEEWIQVDLDDLKSATITSKTATISSNEAFHMLPGIPDAVLRQMILQSISKDHKEAEIMALRIDPPDQQGVLQIESKVKIKDFTKKTGNSYVFKALVDADSIERHDIISLAERKTDIELDGPKRLIANVTITLPDSVAVTFLPKSTDFKDDKFGEYSYRISQTGNVINLRRDLRITAKRISLRDYEEFRNFYRSCIKQDEEMVVLVTKP